MTDKSAPLGKFTDKIKEYLLPIMFAVTVLLLFIYYLFKYADPEYFKSHPNGFKEIFSFALAILSSGMFLAVLKWIQFMGFFREEIQTIFGSSQFDAKLQRSVFDALYSEEFLKKQTDLQAIWKRVTHCYFKTEFPEQISDKVNSKLEESFFHNNHLSHFYRNYFVNLTIDIDEEDFVTITEVADVRIIRPDSSRFMYDFSYYITKHSPADVKSDVKYEFLHVNKIPIDLNSFVTTVNDDKSLARSALIPLENSREYQIYSKVILTYNIHSDPEYKFFSERVIDYIRAEIKFNAHKLRLFFLPIGNEDFREGNAAPDELVKIYDDLLLPERGFRVIFVKI